MSDNVVPFPDSIDIDTPEIEDDMLIFQKGDDVYLAIEMNGPLVCYLICLLAAWLQNERNNER